MKHLILAAMAVVSMSSVAQPSADTWREDCRCHRGIVWGPEQWYEPQVQKVLLQDLDYFPVVTPRGKSPLIVYFHPSMATKTISVTRGVTYSTLVEPARAQGFAVASVEYRHPVQDDFIIPAPHDDIAQAVRWLHDHAAAFGIDTDNVFFLGHSRGSLSLWTALHYLGDPALRVNAVYGYNAQTTYRGVQVAERFIVEADRAAFVTSFEQAHPQHAQFGSALDDARPGAPAVLLHYEQGFFHRLVPADQLTEHHPDFGLALCQAWVQSGSQSPCTAKDNVPVRRAYDGVVEFFLQHMR